MNLAGISSVPISKSSVFSTTFHLVQKALAQVRKGILSRFLTFGALAIKILCVNLERKEERRCSESDTELR